MTDNENLLFDLSELDRNKHKKNIEELKDFAFLYTGTEKGNCSGIHFMTSLDDAVKWCSCDASQGVIHGTRWAYFFTSVYNFMFMRWGQSSKKDDYTLDLRKVFDNGRWDEKLKNMGIKKYDKAEIKRVLSEYGITVLV